MAMKKAKKGPIDYPVGASSKSKKAQGDRMNAQAKSMATSKAKASSASSRRLQAQKDADVKARAARTDAARKKPIASGKGKYVPTGWQKNATWKSKNGTMEMLGASLSPRASLKEVEVPKGTAGASRSGKKYLKTYIKGTYKGKGSK